MLLDSRRGRVAGGRTRRYTASLHLSDRFPDKDCSMNRPLPLLAFAMALTAGCSMQSYDFPEASALDAQPKALQGLPLPTANPIREAYTQCREVKGAAGVVGYVVVYEALPAHARHAERRYPAGTILVENANFKMIGVITQSGGATRFDGDHDVDLGQGTLDELLPKFFGAKGLTHSPISS
jgi:hypothetical protein